MANDATDSFNPTQVMGHRTRSRPISSVDDSGTERLAVDAAVSGVAEINLDETNDEVAVYGGVDGSETADAATRQIINVDSSGRVRTDSTLQIGDTDAPGGSGAVTASTPRVTLATDVGLPTGSNVIGEVIFPNESETDGTITAAAQTVQHTIIQGGGSVTVQITGTWSGQLNFETSADGGTTWVATQMWNEANQDAANAITANGIFRRQFAAALFRVRAASWSSGTATIDINSTVAPGPAPIAGSLPTGTNSIGAVTQGTHDNFNANANLQVGDADVANGNPVPISDAGSTISIDDGGGSITIDTAGGSFNVEGNVAHDAADSGNPVKVGYKAIAHGTNPTAVAANDRTDAYANRHGVPWVIGGHPNTQTIAYRTGTGAQSNDAIITVASGTKIVVTAITATVDEATTVGVSVRVGFGATSTPTEPAAGGTTADIVLYHRGIVPGGGISRGDGSGIIGIGADGEDLRVTTTASTNGDTELVVTYYTIES